MSQITSRLSLGDVADRTRAFVRREAGLLLPLAFATTGLGGLLLNLAQPAVPAGQRAQPGLWLLVFLPVTLLFLIGNLAIAALVVTPGASVREALQAAVARLGHAVRVLLLFVGAALVLSLVIGLVAILIGAAAGRPPQQATGFGMVLLLPVVLVVAVRMLTLWPVMAARPAKAAAVETVKTAFAATRGLFSRLAGVALLYALAYIAIMAAIQFGLGSVLLLIGRATGEVGAMDIVLSVVMSLAGAAIQAVWGVFAAFLYLSMTADSSGT